MGGSPQPTPQAPDPTLNLALLGMQNQAGIGALKAQSAIDLAKSRTPLEARVPDIYGPQGALNDTSKLAAINAYKSKQLEQQMNPAAATARQNIQTAAAQDVNPSYWQNQMGQWSKNVGF